MGLAAEADSQGAPLPGETRIAQGSDDAIRSLGVETTGILPSNPFYFLKEWGRGIRQALSFGLLSRAELELDIVNEQAAEIAKLQELDIKNKDAYSRAVTNYDQSLALLGERIASLKGTEIPDRFSLTVVDHSLQYADILDALYASLAADGAAPATLGEIFAAHEDVAKAVAALADDINDPGRMIAYFRTAIGRSAKKWHELKAVEFLGRLEPIVPQALGDELVKLKAQLMLQLSGRLQGATLGEFQATDASDGGALELVPGTPLERLRSLDALRESAEDSDIKNYVNLIRSKLFDVIESGNFVGATDAKDMMQQTGKVLDAIDAFVSSGGRMIVPATKEAIQRARFTYEGALKFLADGSYAAVYAQASTARAIAESVYADLVLGNGDVGGDIKALKQDYDDLAARVRGSGLTKDDQPELFSALDSAERAVAKVADLVSAKASVARVIDAIHLAKRLVGVAAQLFDGQNQGASPQAADAGMPHVAEAPVNVQIIDGQFVPAVAKIKRGGVVTWTNEDAIPHWIMSSSDASHEALKGFDSQKDIANGEEFAFTFDRTGTWKYHDKLHPEMIGVVDVK